MFDLLTGTDSYIGSTLAGKSFISWRDLQHEGRLECVLMKHAGGITFRQELVFIFISVAFLKTELVTDFISHNTNFF